MTRTLLCFGDSNTYGTPPMVSLTEPHRRLDRATRWTGVCARDLGPDWEVVAEGLPGRTAQFDDPVTGPHMNGAAGLRIALESHGPVDVLAIMLGTNDTKACYAVPPRQIAAGIAGLVAIALSAEMQARHGGFRVLLIAPPPVEETGCLRAIFWGGRERSLALAPVLRDLAAVNGTGFLDAGQHMTVSPVDGVHFDEAGHAALGRAVAGAVRGLVA
ncbi:MAG: SGNH/GDSL hydrolase family protein [Rubellimicrobium sp.]|nr:SGNH/GDSL hydrolase family protein [Rubellimicrobium sp.]